MHPPEKKQGGQFLVYVSEEKARQDIEKFGGLSTNELLVYQVLFFYFSEPPTVKRKEKLANLAGYDRTSF